VPFSHVLFSSVSKSCHTNFFSSFFVLVFFFAHSFFFKFFLSLSSLFLSCFFFRLLFSCPPLKVVFPPKPPQPIGAPTPFFFFLPTSVIFFHSLTSTSPNQSTSPSPPPPRFFHLPQHSVLSHPRLFLFKTNPSNPSELHPVLPPPWGSHNSCPRLPHGSKPSFPLHLSNVFCWAFSTPALSTDHPHP